MTESTLVHLAATARPATKVAAKAALKAAGLKQTLADALLGHVARLDALRLTAKDDRLERRLGYCPVDASARRWTWEAKKGQRGNGIALRKIKDAPALLRRPLRLPSGTPATRLTSVRQAAVLATLGRMIERHAHGVWACVLTSDPAKVGIHCHQYYTGEKAGKWAIQATDTTVTVPADWRVRVQRRGLDLVDGLMTLDAAPLETEGCEVFASTWVRRTGAKGVAVDRGYIARHDGVTYHGATADQAISGLAKKRRELAFSARLAGADLGALVGLCAAVRVSVGDARAVGACSYGIESWCAAVGLPFAVGHASLGEVYAAYQREPRVEARATILRVLRRQRALAEV